MILALVAAACVVKQQFNIAADCGVIYSTYVKSSGKCLPEDTPYIVQCLSAAFLRGGA